MRRVTTIRLVQAVFVILCVTSVLYLLQSHEYIRRYTSSHSGISVVPVSAAAKDHIRQIREFWSPFEQHVRDAKPNAQSIQFVYGGANSKSVDNGDEVRQETQNLVSNPETADELGRAHAQFRTALDLNFDTNGKPKTQGMEGVFRGQGVVMVAGGEYFGPAIVGIHMLRKTGSTLPVEAFVANTWEYESEVCETIFPALNARCVVLTDFIDTNSFEISHFQLKALAILFSSFNDVLYLDSDSVPLYKPETEFFTKEPYISKGLVNWPDFWRATESPLFYRIAGLPSFPKDLPATSTEAGQVLINKTQHLKTLLLAVYYNIYGPRYYYPLLSQGALGQGDKNTFESAAIVLDLPWYRVHTAVKSVGRSDGGEFRGSAMVQSHPDDDFLKTSESEVTDARKSRTEIDVRPAFIHANTPKLNAGHLADEGDLQDRETSARLRLWGPVEEQVKQFGFDVEKEAFQYVIESGCKYGSVLKDWKKRENICARLEQHYVDTFGEASTWNSTM